MTMTHQNTSTHETLPTDRTIKDPDDWTTGDEPMTNAQCAYLQTLCDEAQEPMDESLTKAEASKRIEALQETGRRKRTHQPIRTNETAVTGNRIKDPDDWTTGDERMTGAQRSYLQTLCDETQEPMDDTLTKAEAAKCIEALQQRTGRERRQRSIVGPHVPLKEDRPPGRDENSVTRDRHSGGLERIFLRNSHAPREHHDP